MFKQVPGMIYKGAYPEATRFPDANLIKGLPFVLHNTEAVRWPHGACALRLSIPEALENEDLKENVT
jgi:hypothetical protein